MPLVAKSISASLGKFALPIILIYCFLINIGLFQVYRGYAVDENSMIDSSYSIFLGNPVPLSTSWSHIFPSEGIIEFYYPPLYFYFLAAFIKLFGFATTVPVFLHLVFRFASLIVLFAFLRRKKLPPLIIIILGLWWASFVRIGFYISRPDDIAIFFVLLSLYSTEIAASNKSHFSLITGILLGLSFLVYPIGLIVGFLFCVLNLYLIGVRTIKAYLLLLFSSGITCGLWLLWIIPFWFHFTNFFIGFVVPDAKTKHYFAEIINHLIYLFRGNGPYFDIQTSVLPFALIILIISGILLINKIAPIQRILSFLLPFIISLLIISRNRLHVYSVTWLAIALCFTCAIAFSDYGKFINSATNKISIILTLLFVFTFLQSISLFGLQALNFLGNSIYKQKCVMEPLQEIRNVISPGDKVITHNSLVFYALRSENEIYFPAGFEGNTVPGGIYFHSSYDDSFRWLVTEEPLEKITTYGYKFSWNEETRLWFEGNFELVQQIGNKSACFSQNSLARFSSAQLPVYIYRKK